MDRNEDPGAATTTLIPARFALRDGRECLLRKPLEDDAEEICRLLPKCHAETDFLRWMAGEFDWSVERERAFIGERAADPNTLPMAAVVDGRIVALGSVGPPGLKRFAHHTEFGMCVLQEFWGQGIGRKMLAIILDWARLKRLRKLYLTVFHDNQRAIAMYESFGFEEEARLREAVLRADGAYGDLVYMSRGFTADPPRRER